jgi:hypothetical protein
MKGWKVSLYKEYPAGIKLSSGQDDLCQKSMGAYPRGHNEHLHKKSPNTLTGLIANYISPLLKLR